MDDLDRPPHMTPDQFRELGHRMVDWVASYMERVGDGPVTSDAAPGATMERLPARPPERGDPEAWDDVFRDLDDIVLPNLTHWQHPGFFAYFPCSASGPAILGEIASAGLNVNGMLWATSPAATEIETRVVDWCAELFGLPEKFRSTGPGGGVIQGTASEATLLALIAARGRVAAPARVITSAQAHSSVAKAAMVAGLASGPDDGAGITLIPTDPATGAMRLDFLERTLKDANARPVAMVAATVGTTATGAIDDVPGVASVIGGAGLTQRPWLHIDAAWAGPAAVCPEHRSILSGVEHADSVCLNPHKWMLTNFDCDLMWVADRSALTRALSVTPEYLRNAATDAGGVIDYRDWQIPLGRRFRALKLWFVLRHYGADGLRAHIRRHVAWAEWLEQRVVGHPELELAAARSLSLVCFRHRSGNEATRRVIDRVNATRRLFISHATAPNETGASVLFGRVAIGATSCEFSHVEELWGVLEQAAAVEGG